MVGSAPHRSYSLEITTEETKDKPEQTSAMTCTYDNGSSSSICTGWVLKQDEQKGTDQYMLSQSNNNIYVPQIYNSLLRALRKNLVDAQTRINHDHGTYARFYCVLLQFYNTQSGASSAATAVRRLPACYFPMDKICVLPGDHAVCLLQCKDHFRSARCFLHFRIIYYFPYVNHGSHFRRRYWNLAQAVARRNPHAHQNGCTEKIENIRIASSQVRDGKGHPGHLPHCTSDYEFTMLVFLQYLLAPLVTSVSNPNLPSGVLTNLKSNTLRCGAATCVSLVANQDDISSNKPP